MEGRASATENVTVLFTDLVGSTALSSSVSPDEADELRREHFAVLRQAIAASGGTEVKNLGDGLMVVFGAASVALGCAVAMQQGVERDNRTRNRNLGLRIGLSVGEVSREEGSDYFGDPVVEAARLCAECASGQILAADVVRLMAGRRSRHECRPIGELELKGLPDPVATVEVAWEPMTAPDGGTVDLPLPSRLVFRPTVGVVGRAAETGTITDAYKRIANGEPREILLVAGEAGLGKTTLVAEAARAAFESGAVVLFGHCEEDLATPYQLFREALGHYVTHAPADRLATHVAAHGSELARLIPALGSRIPDLPPSKATDSDTERFLLFAAVVGLLADASRDAPVVLVLDDVHWADKASLSLLRHLAAADPTMRLLVVATYRDDELSHADALVETLAALRRQSGVSRVDLAGLDDIGVLAFFEAAAGQTLDTAGVGLAHAVYRETDGNPFFVSEVLRHLAETGAIFQDPEGRWTADVSLDNMGLPDSVREVIGARVVRLGGDAGRALSIAAVIGRDFDIDLLARATGMAEDDLLDILDAATAAALVRELGDRPGRYNFAHALIQHTLYEDLGPTRRARAHRQVGEALEALCGDRPGERVAELARHWTSATQPAEATKAIAYSRQAGDAALAALAPADALGHYARALDLYPQATDPDPVLALDLAIGIGTAQRLTGDPAFRETLLDAAHRAEELGDTSRLVAAALANVRGLYSNAGALDADKVEVLELAIDRLPENDSDRALLLASLCAELGFVGTLARREALADEAISVARASDDEAAIVRVLNLVAQPLFVPSLVEQSKARTEDALQRAERLGDPILLFWAANARIRSASQVGDIGEMDRSLAILGSLAEQLRQPHLLWWQAVQRATRATIDADTGTLEQLANHALELGFESGQPDALTLFGDQFWQAQWRRGTLEAVIPVLEPMTAEAPDLSSIINAGLAIAYADTGRPDDARRLFDQAAAQNFDLPMNEVWLMTLSAYVEVLAACGDATSARILHDLLAPWAGLWIASGTSVGSTVSHSLGLISTVLGRYDDADAYFADASECTARAGRTFFSAQLDWRWGQMLVQRNGAGDRTRARELLERAQTSAVSHGYPHIEKAAADALQRLGE
jgi:class 3 adenylate cyclase/tetratricopeptide (TPR) repeat protein